MFAQSKLVVETKINQVDLLIWCSKSALFIVAASLSSPIPSNAG